MAQDLCLPSSHFFRRHLFLVSGQEPCDRCLRQEDEHRLAVLTQRMARHLLLDDAEVGKEMPDMAEFQHLNRLRAMNQNSSSRQSKNRGCGRGNGETRPSRGRPLGLPPFTWPPLLKPPPPLPHHLRVMLLDTSGGRKESIGTSVFLP